nr:hypothetical protein [Mycobacterium sp. BK086]
MELAQRGPNGRKQREVTLAGVGRDRADLECIAHLLQLLGDVELVGIPIDVAPPQAEHFAAAHAIHDEEQEGRVESICKCRRKEMARFFGCPRGEILTFPGRQGHEPGHIAKDEFLAHGTGECGTQDGAGQLHEANRVTLGELLIEHMLQRRH